MQPQFLRFRASNAPIRPGDELVFVTPRHLVALENSVEEPQKPTVSRGLSDLLQRLGPCPAPAALRAGVSEPEADAYWVALELCHWRIEPGGLRWMAHGEALSISSTESDQLFTELQDIFASSPAVLQRSAKGDLSVRCEATLTKPEALEPEQLFGAEMKPHLPNLTLWQRWLNEAQMQLASSAVNTRRAQAGQRCV